MQPKPELTIYPPAAQWDKAKRGGQVPCSVSSLAHSLRLDGFYRDDNSLCSVPLTTLRSPHKREKEQFVLLCMEKNKTKQTQNPKRKPTPEIQVSTRSLRLDILWILKSRSVTAAGTSHHHFPAVLPDFLDSEHTSGNPSPFYCCE